MGNYNSFEFLKKLSFERMGGTDNELKAANMIVDECAKLGVTAHLEGFMVDAYEIKEAKLEACGTSFNVTGVGMSGNTPVEGVTGPLFVLESEDKVNDYDLTGKIVFVAGRMGYKTYKALCEKKAIGFICASGSLYDDLDKSDLDQMTLRPRHYENGKIPGVCIRMIDAQKIILDEVKEVTLTLIQEEKKVESHNVVAEIKGSEKPEEVIVFTAHYDSVKFSTGAYDNGTGSTTILEALAYFNEFKPKRTLKFVWCGSEEMGLLGSKAYTEAHKDELEAYKLCINIDMTGVVIGKDIACCTTKASFADYINYVGKEVGFNISARQGVYSSDSTPFADKGVPAISFARLAPRGGAEIHSRKDVIDFLDSKNYYRTCEFINYFADKMDKAWTVPVERIIPDEMKKELDIYLGRKERDGK